MEQANRGLERSLACVQHPASLLCIAILLLNDHLLKSAAPSWMTGKLSDFAGLFFFPFVLAAGLSVLLARARLSARQIGGLASALVATGFLLLKASALSNSLAGQVMSAVMGRPTVFALDPTDLIALAALLPAWWLWEAQRIARPNRLAYAALVLGALAAMATSPRERTVYAVTDLAYAPDGTLYAADKSGETAAAFPVAVSHDAGLTWKLSYDEEQDTKKIDPKTDPIQYCKSLEYYGVTHCYRVTWNHQFEYGFLYNSDKGKKAFSWYPVFPKNALTVKAYDLIVVPCGKKSCILVAIGDAGILRRELPDGNWQLIEVLGAKTHEIFSNDP